MIVSGKIDIKEILEQTLSMWNEIAEDPRIDKIIALKSLCYSTEVYSDCPVCDYVVNNFGFDTVKGFLYPQCSLCPLEWKEVNRVDGEDISPCISSYFGLWINKYAEYIKTKNESYLKSLKLYALKIAYTAEKKLDELENGF